MVQEENAREGVDKHYIKQAIKSALGDGMLKFEDQTQGYWWGMQVIMECMIELVGAGFAEKERRIEVFEKLFESVIELIKDGRIYE